MKKFDDLMSVSNEIENISASDAKEKINDPNVQFIDVRDKESFSKGTIGNACLLYTSPSPRDRTRSRMPSSA